MKNYSFRPAAGFSWSLSSASVSARDQQCFCSAWCWSRWEALSDHFRPGVARQVTELIIFFGLAQLPRLAARSRIVDQSNQRSETSTHCCISLTREVYDHLSSAANIDGGSTGGRCCVALPRQGSRLLHPLPPKLLCAGETKTSGLQAASCEKVCRILVAPSNMRTANLFLYNTWYDSHSSTAAVRYAPMCYEVRATAVRAKLRAYCCYATAVGIGGGVHDKLLYLLLYTCLLYTSPSPRD